MKTSGATRIRGFTLVEVLVVLMLTGMIAVLLLQMMTILFRGYDQIGRIQGEVSLNSMRNGWFRDSINALAASLDEEFSFAGTPAQMTGFTMAPLVSRQGKLTMMAWEIRYKAKGTELWYAETGLEPALIGQWPDSELRFAYRGQNSGWMDTWPPADLPAGVLPYRIKLNIADDGGDRDVFAAIKVRRTGRYDYRDFL